MIRPSLLGTVRLEPISLSWSITCFKDPPERQEEADHSADGLQVRWPPRRRPFPAGQRLPVPSARFGIHGDGDMHVAEGCELPDANRGQTVRDTDTGSNFRNIVGAGASLLALSSAAPEEPPVV